MLAPNHRHACSCYLIQLPLYKLLQHQQPRHGCHLRQASSSTRTGGHLRPRREAAVCSSTHQCNSSDIDRLKSSVRSCRLAAAASAGCGLDKNSIICNARLVCLIFKSWLLWKAYSHTSCRHRVALLRPKFNLTPSCIALGDVGRDTTCLDSTGQLASYTILFSGRNGKIEKWTLVQAFY